MNDQRAPTMKTESRARPSDAQMRGRELLLARGTWVAGPPSPWRSPPPASRSTWHSCEPTVSVHMVQVARDAPTCNSLPNKQQY